MKKNVLWYCRKISLIVVWLAFFSTNAGAIFFQTISVTPGYCHNIDLTPNPENVNLSYKTPYNLTCSYSFDKQPSGQEKISINGNFVEFDSAKMDQTPYTISTAVETIGKNEVKKTSTNEINVKNIKGTITINNLLIDEIELHFLNSLTFDNLIYPDIQYNLLGFCNDSKQALQISCNTTN